MKSCLLGCFTLLAIPFAILFIAGSLNYSGFCWPEMRYLSDEDKFKIVFYSMNQQDSIPITTNDKGMQYYEQIKYESFEDFMEINPDCCVLNPGWPYERPPIEFVDRITGFDNGEVIGMNYIIRYLDSREQKSKKIKIQAVLKNCGERKY